jgi:hypothetical protein
VGLRADLDDLTLSGLELRLLSAVQPVASRYTNYVISSLKRRKYVNYAASHYYVQTFASIPNMSDHIKILVRLDLISRNNSFPSSCGPEF